MVSVALLSQYKKSGCGIAHSRPCIAGDNIPNGLEGFVGFCKVLYFFCNFWRTDRQTDRPTDRQTDRPTDLGIKAPSRSLKTLTDPISHFEFCKSHLHGF